MEDDFAPQPRKKKGAWEISVRQWTQIVFVCAVVATGLGWLINGAQQARKAARSAQCICNLCAIKLALRNYHDANGGFPPASLADANGKPMHSWRVLILPYMEYQPIYDAYNFSQPWDGPDNAKLASFMPGLYACPNHREGKETTLTDYVVVTGPGTLFPAPNERTRMEDVTDGTANTIMVIEAAGLNVPWMAPFDLDTSRSPLKVNDFSAPNPAAYDPSGPAAAMADGSYRRFRTGTPPELIRAMTTIAGGEVIDGDRVIAKPPGAH